MLESWSAPNYSKASPPDADQCVSLAFIRWLIFLTVDSIGLEVTGRPDWR